MDFLLSKDSVRNCTVTLLTGQPAYKVSTPSQFFHAEKTTIKKLKGHEMHDMAFIELHNFHDNVYQSSQPSGSSHSHKTPPSGKSFIASNGQKYTWKTKSNGLRLRDTFDNTLVVFEESSVGFFGWKSRPAKLSISQAGVSIVDDIVATFVLVEQKRRERRNAAGGGGGPDGGGGGGNSGC